MPKKKLVIKKHSVKVSLQVVELTKAGTAMTLEVFGENEKLGTITVGRGSLYWTGGGRQISKRVTWSRFAAMMDDLAYGS